jgi:hypothetical protein
VSDREDFRAARDAGLKARHETRLARAQAVIPDGVIAAAQTAFDAVAIKQGAVDDVDGQYQDCMRAALEAALPHLRGRIGYELGRKETAEAIAAELDAYADNYPTDIFPADSTTSDAIAAKAMRHAYPNAARIARDYLTGDPK